MDAKRGGGSDGAERREAGASERGGTKGAPTRADASGGPAEKDRAAGRSRTDGGGESERGSVGGPAPLTHREYAVFARQTPEQIQRDCEVSVFRATGPGGQGVNTTDSAVRMRHVPTGITVVCRESRSQLQNRQACLAKLHAIFERRSRPPKPRTPTKVSRAQKERRLQGKHKTSQKKSLRRAPGRDDW